MTQLVDPHDTDLQALTCKNHPDRETSLRCNRCSDPICPNCAILTPTGYRCKQCVRGQQKIFETAEPQDYFIAVAIGGVLAFLGSLFIPRLGFFSIFLAPLAGNLIAEAIRAAVRKRRSRRLFQLAAGATALGCIVQACTFLLFGSFGFQLLWYGLYAFLTTSTLYYRLSGISLRA